jgi:hypothetical protein
MTVLETMNDLLERGTGRRFMRPVRAEVVPVKKSKPRPPRDAGDRLLRAPVFLLSSPRAGSTLLRAVLDSHSAIHAPIELHARRLSVQLTTPPVEQAMTALDIDSADLEHLLWDRLLHLQLTRSGKSLLVEKTPSNVFAVDRLKTCWPDARFIYLLRHPLASAQSWHESDPETRPMSLATQHVLKYTKAVEDARRTHPGLVVRYEDLIAEPEAETRRICEFLEVPWEADMLDYARENRDAEFVKGIGDWSDKIRSGRIQEGRPLPAADEVPPELREIARTWDYLPA